MCENKVLFSLNAKISLFTPTLTEAMNRDVHLSFNSYDRFFPNQDSLPEGGFGNLVALPLQEKARRNGNSVFVDESFQAYLDQWNFLQNIQKMSEATIDAIVQKNGSSLGELVKSSESKPWEVQRWKSLSNLISLQTLH